MDSKKINKSILTPKAAAILTEISEALDRLAKSLAEGGAEQEHTIFIDKIGLDHDDRQAIRDYLGVGGVKINYDATVEPVEWTESAISGIWFGVFYDQNRKPIVETIEICRFPQVASAQEDDIKIGYVALAEKLKEVINCF